MRYWNESGVVMDWKFECIVVSSDANIGNSDYYCKRYNVLLIYCNIYKISTFTTETIIYSFCIVVFKHVS